KIACDGYIINILEKNDKGTNETATITEKFKLFINSTKDSDSEIIIISPCLFQPHVLHYINDSGLAPRLSIYQYDKFKIVFPLCPGTSSCYILHEKEAQEISDYFNIKKVLMKRFYMDNAIVIWLGAKPGDIIDID